MTVHRYFATVHRENVENEIKMNYKKSRVSEF